jgi:hypothetical protein
VNAEVTAQCDQAPDALRSLHAWLLSEDQFRGRVALRIRRPVAVDVVPVAEAVVAALPPGSAASTLALQRLSNGLITWLCTRPGTVDVTITTPRGTATVSAAVVRELAIHEVMRLTDALIDILGPDPDPEPEPAPPAGELAPVERHSESQPA